MKKAQNTNIGKFLKKLRIDRDQKAEDMAVELGISQSQLSLIELGKAEPNKQVLSKINKMKWQATGYLPIKNLNEDDQLALIHIYEMMVSKC